MGLFDRFKRTDTPGVDALTKEAAARMLARDDVTGVEAADGNTLQITWRNGETGTLSLAEIRPRWADTRGFERIQVMDGFFESVGPADTSPASDEAETRAPTPAAAHDQGSFDAARPALRVEIRRAGTALADVTWPVADGVIGVAMHGDQLVTHAQIVSWGCDAERVRHAATENLCAADPRVEHLGDAGTAWVVTRPEGQAAVWLTAPQRLLEAIGIAEAVVLAPLTSELVVVELQDTDTITSVLASTLEILDQTSSDADALPAIPLLASPDGLRRWTPPPDHPAAALVEQVDARS